MKILSKYKDYYDYLTGIYGEDPLIILDRRSYKKIDLEYKGWKHRLFNVPQIYKFSLIIGNFYIEGIKYGDSFYYGDDIYNIPEIIKKDHGYYENKDPKLYNCYQITSNLKYGRDYMLRVPIKLERPELLSKEIVISFGEFGFREYSYNYNYPILKDLNLNKFIDAEIVYQWIYNYISEQNLQKEQHQDLRTDIQKLEGKGFDKKISFRNIK